MSPNQKKTSIFRGIFTAVVTPFEKSGEIDWEAFKKILHDQKLAGISGVVVCGTTGESPTLKIEEKKKLILCALEELNGSETKVIAGTTNNNTQDSIELSRWASHQKVAGILAVTPFYNKPSPLGLFAHFTSIADAVENCEVMLYNVPGRTGISLSSELVVKLAAHPRIRSIKEASGNPALTAEILNQARAAGVPISVLSGDDPTFLDALKEGAVGNVSVASNVAPRNLISIQSLFEKGKVKEAEALNTKMLPFMKSLFMESNPGPVKWILNSLGVCEKDMRLPMMPPMESTQVKLKEVLAKVGFNAFGAQ